VILCLFAFAAVVSAIHRAGSIEVDNWTFDKVVDGDENVLVVFQEQSWKEIKDFEKVVQDLRERADLVIVRVDASEASSEELKKRFNVDKLPAIRFVSEKTKTVYNYEGAENAEEVVQFVQSSISPLLRSLAELAKKFTAATGKKALLAEAKKIAGTLGANDVDLGKMYITSMERVIEKGDSYIANELDRLRKLVENKATTQAKKAEFGRRINILNAFSAESKQV